VAHYAADGCEWCPEELDARDPDRYPTQVGNHFVCPDCASLAWRCQLCGELTGPDSPIYVFRGDEEYAVCYQCAAIPQNERTDNGVPS